MTTITKKFKTIDKAQDFRNLFLNARGLPAVGVRSAGLHYSTRSVTIVYNPAKYIGGFSGKFEG
jgi:hypothetical protein